MRRAREDGQGEVLAQLFRNPLRLQLLFKYAEGVTSPSTVAAALGERLNLVSYHTQVLLRAGCIELVRTERRRGADKHFYRAVLTSEIDDAGWGRLPPNLRRALARLTLNVTWREAGDAIPRGGMDRATAHVSRSYFFLDGEGRSALASLLLATLESAEEIERASRDRAPGDAVPYELVIMSFERASSP